MEGTGRQAQGRESPGRRGNSVTFNRENHRPDTPRPAGSGSQGRVLVQLRDVVQEAPVEPAAGGVLLQPEDLELCSRDQV